MVSINTILTAGLAALIPFTSAYVKPVGDKPEGNAFSAPGLGSIVPVGKPFTVTWAPSTTGPVTLVLLKGPSENAVPQYAIAEHLPNSGSYEWTPSADLAASDSSSPDKGYGIQLIDEKTGQYQYTTQFGISNDKSISLSSASGSTSTSSCTTSSGTAPTGYPTQNSTKPYPVSNNATTPAVGPTAPGPAPVAAPTTMVSSPQPAAPAPAPAQTSSRPSTNGAGAVVASFGGMVFAVGAAVMVL